MTIEAVLWKRAHAKCELCSGEAGLSAYLLPPATVPCAEKSVLLCTTCREGLHDRTDINRWRCLGESMWSEHAAVQVLAWRILQGLSEQDWAQNLLQQLYLDEDTLKWAEEGMREENIEAARDEEPTKDSNGNILQDGDAVTLIKDLDVKGANFTAKRGTVVKNISLTANPAHIEGRVNGTQIVLLTCFLKKVV